jgi:transcriptional regulator with XRE-family HTH domain
MVAEASTFGSLLKQLRLANGLSQPELAQQAHFSQSYISRVERGEHRIPTALHVQALVEALGLEGVAAEDLFRAAGFLPPSTPGAVAGEPAVDVRTAAHYRLVEQFLAGSSGDHQYSTSIAVEDLPSHQVMVHGREESLRLAIALLNAIPPRKRRSSSDRPVCITSQGTDPFDDLPELRTAWWAALHAVLERGWDVVHLVRLDGEGRYAFNYIQNALTLLGTAADGKYQPRYFPAHGLLQPPHDLLIVPRTGGMQLFASDGTEYIDVGQFYPLFDHKSYAIASLQHYFDWMVSCTRPLANLYDRLSAGFLRDVSARSLTGEHWLMTDGIDWLPLLVDDDNADMVSIARSNGDKSDLARAILANRRFRHKAFSAKGQKTYRVICPMRALEKFAASGEYHTSLKVLGVRNRTPVERIVRLNAVISQLEANDRYHLCLLSNAEARQHFKGVISANNANGIICQVHDATPSMRRRTVYVWITEPSAVTAGMDFLQRVWESVVPEHRTRTWVVDWLRHLVSTIDAEQ